MAAKTQIGSRPRKMTVSTPIPTSPTSWLLRKNASTTANAAVSARRSAASNIRRTSQPRRIRQGAVSLVAVFTAKRSNAASAASPGASGAPTVDVALNANVSPPSRELTISNQTTVSPPSCRPGSTSVEQDGVPQMPQKSPPLY